MLPLIIGYLLDLIIGDPQGFPHPIRLIGNIITKLENILRINLNNEEDERKSGIILWFIVVGFSFIVPFMILYFIYEINEYLGITLESIMCYYILATRSLKDESMKVYTSLKNNNLTEARKFLSYIVGRDTENLDEISIAKATVETVAENASDGVIAPLIFIIIGGAPLGFMYKAINTLDSMVGYKNERYINFGRFSAMADDVANFIPSRISAYLMIAASFIIGFDYKSAYRIFKRDRFNHKSPNSAQTESVCAGALNIMLGGSNYYKGILVQKPTIGDNMREIEIQDIKKANKLMYATSIICLIIGVVILI
ncbi:MAG: adenosylcobinamide-phosphate synthase CbiB [Tissierellia bacterium]|nr:adenosylcobinamide-phosphate synthase CbiB [Tissierellia bacterium]MDD4781563.1 adenosylcobinamide-phosphate synthase CbiB [Tissierellia bacterium]